MKNIIPKSVQSLIDAFSSLPGIGPKTASRLTFYLLHRSKEEIENFSRAVAGISLNIKTCSICNNIAESDPCVVCSDSMRDQSKICAVENPLDVIAIEKTGEYHGLYHVLGGAISPVDGVGPEDLKINQLLERIKKSRGKIKEIILATNPDLEGEATAMYIEKQISNLKLRNTGLRITRIARGLPVGGDLEYADEITLTRALEGRKEY